MFVCNFEQEEIEIQSICSMFVCLFSQFNKSLYSDLLARLRSGNGGRASMFLHTPTTHTQPSNNHNQRGVGSLSAVHQLSRASLGPSTRREVTPNLDSGG